MNRLTGVPLLGLVLLLATASPVRCTIYWTPAHELAPVGWGGPMTAADFDADGDIDISVLGLSPAHQYWNIGSASSPEWLLGTTEFEDVPWCVERDGDLGDLDADGDLDLAVVCWYDDFVRYYRNTGAPGAAVWEEDDSVLEGVPFWGSRGHPRFADMDADGDLDLLIGSSGGTVSFARNVGTIAEPAFVDEGWISRGSDSQPVDQPSAPAMSTQTGTWTWFVCRGVRLPSASRTSALPRSLPSWRIQICLRVSAVPAVPMEWSCSTSMAMAIRTFFFTRGSRCIGCS